MSTKQKNQKKRSKRNTKVTKDIPTSTKCAEYVAVNDIDDADCGRRDGDSGNAFKQLSSESNPKKSYSDFYGEDSSEDEEEKRAKAYAAMSGYDKCKHLMRQMESDGSPQKEKAKRHTEKEELFDEDSLNSTLANIFYTMMKNRVDAVDEGRWEEYINNKETDSEESSDDDEERMPDVPLGTCYYCGKKDDTKTCSRCQTATYCNRDCQKNDFKAHKLLCKKKEKQDKFNIFFQNHVEKLLKEQTEQIEERKQACGRRKLRKELRKQSQN